MKKNIIFALFIVFLVCVLLLSACVVKRHCSHNMFDEIYYTYVSPDAVDTKFENVPSLQNNTFQVPDDLAGSERDNELYLLYDNGYLKNNTRAYLTIDPKEELIKWTCTVNYSDKSIDLEYGNDEELVFEYSYNLKDRSLTILPIAVKSTILAEENHEKYLRNGIYGEKDYVKAFCELHDISNQDISKQATYFLDEIIVRLWVEGNRGYSQYSVDNIGDCRIIDNLWKMIEE